MRFLHTADWHLGRNLFGRSLIEDQLHFLHQFLELIRDTRPEAVLIAGDVYDRSVPPTDAVEALDDFVSECAFSLKVPVVMVPGNHDGSERLAFGARLLAEGSFHVFKTFSHANVVTFPSAHGPVDVYAVPYAEPPVARQDLDVPTVVDHQSAMQELVDRITRTKAPGRRSILMAHGFVSGGLATESERPLHIGTVAAISPAIFDGFQYTALGHLHRPQSIGSGPIHYSGAPLAYSFGEAGQTKSVNLVELDAAGAAHVQLIPVVPKRAVRTLSGRFDELMKPRHDRPVTEDYLEVTLQDPGPILDPISRLREIYPNVLHVVRAALLPTGAAPAPSIDHRQAGMEQLFSSFFEQVTGAALSDAERAAFLDVYRQTEPQTRRAGR